MKLSTRLLILLSGRPDLNRRPPEPHSGADCPAGQETTPHLIHNQVRPLTPDCNFRPGSLVPDAPFPIYRLIQSSLRPSPFPHPNSLIKVGGDLHEN